MRSSKHDAATRRQIALTRYNIGNGIYQRRIEYYELSKVFRQNKSRTMKNV